MNRTEANEKVLEIISNSEVEIVGMDLAKNVIPGMKENLVLHAGPPITWERMCGPMKGAVIGALIYEGKAKTEEEAIRLIENGEIEFSPNHDHQTVGPMAGIITSNYPVFIIQNKTYGNFAFSNINEGAGKALRFGAYNNDVISRLHWIREKMFPILKEAIEKSGGINIKSIVTQALQMGDDNHNRNKASTALLLNELSKYLVQSSYEKEEVAKVCMHLERIDMFNVNLVMATMKSISDAIMNQDVKGSTIVAVMARNGTDFGIKLSGVKDKWFVAPANIPEGLYFPGYSEKDAAGDIGDSCITETFGLGGFVDFASASKELRIDHQRGFGETLGSYGVDAGTYIVLPIYNATTPRQLTGAVVDAAYMYPFWEWIGGPWSLVKYGVQAVDTRAKNLDNAELLRQAQDPYVTFREAYYQNLQFKVSDGKSEDHQETLPDDVLKEIDQ